MKNVIRLPKSVSDSVATALSAYCGVIGPRFSEFGWPEGGFGTSLMLDGVGCEDKDSVVFAAIDGSGIDCSLVALSKRKFFRAFSWPFLSSINSSMDSGVASVTDVLLRKNIVSRYGLGSKRGL